MEARRLRLAARGGLAVALAALTGCGSLSEADYTERAGTLCHQATEPLRTRVRGQDFADLGRLAPEVTRRYAAALRGFEDLEPPETRREDHEALVGAGRRLQAGYRRLAAALDRVDEEAALAALARSKRDRLATARAARALRLRVCAEAVEEVADAVLVPVYRSQLRTLQTDVEVARSFQRDGDRGTAAYSGAALIDRVAPLARLEPPRNAAAVHDRMVRALSAYAQALVTRHGSGAAGPTLRAIRQAREALRPAPEPGKPA
jgi:hypothetical protein